MNNFLYNCLLFDYLTFILIFWFANILDFFTFRFLLQFMQYYFNKFNFFLLECIKLNSINNFSTNINLFSIIWFLYSSHLYVYYLLANSLFFLFWFILNNCIVDVDLLQYTISAYVVRCFTAFDFITDNLCWTILTNNQFYFTFFSTINFSFF